MSSPVRFSPTGPEGWMQIEDAPLKTAKPIESRPMGLDHVYLERAESGLYAGVWRASPYTEYLENYPVDEFMYVVNGSVTLEWDTFSETFRRGDAFLLPKGFRGVWRQSEPVVKYYMVVA
ncbi:MAG: DUF861 domain-containing protein [Mesorhizobium sp.]|nr:MAG: DUF861 domain-containing protein [Mesorhizobium sp.]TKB96685.1 MAG: DUF861 domain-containing protein [Mesorhizobium sp.]